jgi:large subunit ribosomal protein L20
LRHAWTYAFRDRKAKKRTNRGLQNLQINAATRNQGLTYSKFIAGLKAKKIELDRKVLSQLAQLYPEIFSKIVEEVKTK